VNGRKAKGEKRKAKGEKRKEVGKKAKSEKRSERVREHLLMPKDGTTAYCLQYWKVKGECSG
jgi:hypothetical protein